MFCYRCGCLLSEHRFCTACGADVSLYKKIMAISNYFYNEGLERASVRDLSGAVTSLRQSLKWNKNQIDARNLLGLVYFESGEVVAAFREWVISKNLQAEDNIAEEYLNVVQESTGKLEILNQTMTKYNKALAYCHQNSLDLAIIQLKKVLSLNPKFVKAHQLLALLYMNQGEWESAHKELAKCEKIDQNHTITLRYQHIVGQHLKSSQVARKPDPPKKEEIIRYQCDNEIIIQPANVKEPNSGLSVVWNMVIGLLIGLAVMYFLVRPGLESNANYEAQKKVTEIGNQLDTKTVRVQELETQTEKLNQEIQDLQEQMKYYVSTEGNLSTVDSLFHVATQYLERQDQQQTAAELEQIAATVDVTQTSEQFQALYNALLGAIGPKLIDAYYREGYNAYRAKNYEVAIQSLTKVLYYDADNVDALFYLADSYRKSEDTRQALSYFEQLIEKHPNTDRAKKAMQYTNEIKAQEAQ